MEKKYLLHRISHEWAVSYYLYEKGYLSLGWSAFTETDILNDARKDDNYQAFENTYHHYRPNEKKRSRWDMWYLAQFNVGDIIVVPLFGGKFSICEVAEIAKPIFEIKEQIADFYDKTGEFVKWCDNSKLLKGESSTECIDLGFAIKVEILADGISRKDYADNKLTARMKMRQTNGDISDISESVKKALNGFKDNKPINFYETALESAASSLYNAITTLTPDNFEMLVKNYMECIGADYVYIPAKNEHGKKDQADADVVALFNTLKVCVLIQVKKHEYETSDFAVKPIIRYKEQLEDSDSELWIDCEGGFNYITWVVSSCDDFSEEAKAEGTLHNVRLISGKEFSKMLADAGLSKIEI